MRKVSLVAAAAACALAPASSAGAAGKERIVVERFSEPYEFAVDCSEFGPYDFHNIVTGRQRVKVTEVVADDGTLLQTVFHIGFRETDTNSESQASLPLKGAVHEVWDYESNTRTIDGNVATGTQRGSGTYIHDTGRITMTLDTQEALFVAGPHEAFFAGGIDMTVCAALAEAG